MGLGIVLLFWAFVGVVAATVGAVVFGFVTASVTRGVAKRRTAIVAATLVPFACLAWAGAVFVFQAVVNEGLLHRDLGIGDTWHCPLPNGYQIIMINVTDQGSVYNPTTQRSGVVVEQDDSVMGVRKVHVAGRYILGASDTKWFEHLSQDRSNVDSYFLLDTEVGKKRQFPSYEELRIAAQQLGVNPHLESIYRVYSTYRFTSFDVLAGLLFFVPPIAIGGFLIRWIARLRRMPPVSVH